MPTTSTHVIGYVIDLSKGSHLNTEFKVERLQLKEIGFTNAGAVTYASHGEWVSEVVIFKDEYLSLENLAIGSLESSNGSTYKAHTRTSVDGKVWSDYVSIDDVTGKIQSTKNKYLQIKVEFIGKEEKIESTVETFNKNDSRGRYNNSEHVDIDKGLRLKRDYHYKMNRDKTWTNEGYLLRKKIKATDFKKLDSLVIQ